MSDNIEELKTDSKEQNLTTGEYLEFAKNYVLNYKVTKYHREEIALITMGQSSNSNWFKRRIGRITGSVAHGVQTKREGTVKAIIGKCSLDDDKLPPQIKHGPSHEDDAIEHVSIVRFKFAKILS